MVRVRSSTPLLLACGLVLITATGCGGGPALWTAVEDSRPSPVATAPQPPLDPGPYNAVLR